MKAVRPRCSQQHSLMWNSPLLLSGISPGNQEAVHLDEQPLFSVQTLLPVDCALYAKLCTLSNTVLLHPEKLNPTAMQEFLLAEAPHTNQASQIHTVVILLSHPAISPPDHQSKGFSLFEELPRSFQTNKL